VFRGLVAGQYVPRRSFVHGLDPRTKILASLALITVIFLVGDFPGYGVLAALVIASIAASWLPILAVLRGLRPILFLVVLTFLLQVFLGGHDDGTVLWGGGPFVVTREGVREGAFVAVRLLILVTSTSLLTLTTSPMDLTEGLERLLRPFRRVGVPAHELAMMMTIALRFVPTLIDETEKIMKAQMARGAELQSGNLFQRARAMIPILVPLFVSAFRRADELALAMEARCYRGGEGRTRMRQLRFGAGDLFAAFTVTAVGALAVWWGRVS